MVTVFPIRSPSRMAARRLSIAAGDAATGVTIMQMDAQLLESNNQMMYLQGMQGLQEFQLANL